MCQNAGDMDDESPLKGRSVSGSAHYSLLSFFLYSLLTFSVLASQAVGLQASCVYFRRNLKTKQSKAKQNQNNAPGSNRSDSEDLLCESTGMPAGKQRATSFLHQTEIKHDHYPSLTQSCCWSLNWFYFDILRCIIITS